MVELTMNKLYSLYQFSSLSWQINKINFHKTLLGRFNSYQSCLETLKNYGFEDHEFTKIEMELSEIEGILNFPDKKHLLKTNPDQPLIFKTPNNFKNYVIIEENIYESYSDVFMKKHKTFHMFNYSSHKCAILYNDIEYIDTNFFDKKESENQFEKNQLISYIDLDSSDDLKILPGIIIETKKNGSLSTVLTGQNIKVIPNTLISDKIYFSIIAYNNLVNSNFENFRSRKADREKLLKTISQSINKKAFMMAAKK